MFDVKSRIRDAGRSRDRRGVPVERQQATRRAQRLQNQARMSATPESGIDIGAVRVGDQVRDGLCSEDRQVPVGARWRGGRHSPSEREVRGRIGQAVGERLTLVLAQASHVPQFEVSTHAEQHHVAFKAGRVAQFG